MILNEQNLGFARGMNQGLAVARGEYVAFCNNDTVLPERWASTLLETIRCHERAGIVVPALTAARGPVNVRTEPGDKVEALPPFSAPPGAVVYVMNTDLVRQLGAWDEGYEIASGEDVDLAFTVWVNDLDILYDQRVLVDHVGKGSADPPRRLARSSGRATGSGSSTSGQATAQCPVSTRAISERFARNRATARAAAGWMERYFALVTDPRRSRSARDASIRRTARAGRGSAGRPRIPLGSSDLAADAAAISRRNRPAGAQRRQARRPPPWQPQDQQVV